MINRKKLCICIFCLALLTTNILAGCKKQKENLPDSSVTAENEDTVSTQPPKDISSGKDDFGQEQVPPEDTDAEPPLEPEQPSSELEQPSSELEQPSSEPEQPSSEPEQPQSETVLMVSDREEIKEELTDAITQMCQPQKMDISKVGLTSPVLDAKNIYYEITRQSPELKYAFDLTAEVNGSELTCTIHYMPYKNGSFPADFSGVKVDSLGTLLSVAEEYMGEEPVSIYITNTSLDPDTMNHALQQVGGGYVNCILNVDATEIRYDAPLGMTMSDCIAALDSVNQLADEVIAQTITEGMTQREQAEALYSYVTKNVSYDHRYYSDRANMPYESQTALGALRDGIAICGGYSHAVKLLFEKVGISCFNVTGYYFRENHMWNYVILDGKGYYCDATADRGGMSNHFMLTVDEMTELGTYSWNHESIA